MKAVIFDMDGVIVDSEAHWKALDADYFRSLVPHWSAQDEERITGLGVDDLFRLLCDDYDVRVGKQEFLAHCEVTARKVYEERVDCADGFLDFARELKHKGVRTAIASSSPLRWVNMVLNRFALSPLLDTVVTADDVGGRTKPLPDLYLEAAAKLDMPPGACLAIEDTSIGLLAAKRAGMKAAGFRTEHNEQQDFTSADFILGSFSGLDYERLISRLRR